MPEPGRPLLGLEWARPVLAVLLLVGWLAGALVATSTGAALLEPFAPCRGDSGCNGSAILAAEYALCYGPLLLWLAVLPIATARMLQHRDPLPAIAIGAGAGAGAVAVLIAVAMLIAAVAG